MLTTIGSVGITVVLIVFIIVYVLYAVVKTPAGHFTMIGDFGGKPLFALKPGWKILWGKPLRRVLIQTRVQLRNVNIPSFPLTCLIDDLPTGDFDLTQHGTVELTSGTISFAYKVRTPHDEDERELFFEQYPVVKVDSEFTLDYSLVEERVRDLIREKIKLDTARLGIISAMSSPVKIASQARTEVEAHTASKPDDNEEQLMIDLVSLNIDSPFAPKNLDMREELDKKARAKVELSAAKEQMGRLQLEAGMKVAISEKEAEAEAVAMQRILTAYGKNLTEKERLTLYMTQQSLQAMKAIGSSSSAKVFVSGNLLAEAQVIVSKLFGGRP